MASASTPTSPGRLPSDPADVDPRVIAFRLLLVTGQRLRARMDEHLRPSGLTTQQATVISTVEELGSPTLSIVADRLGTSHQNARQIADALARKGLLEIQSDPADQRRRLLLLTPAARSFWANRNEDDFDVVCSWMTDLEPSAAHTLVELLGSVLDSLESPGR
jgi:DNA-binding MarR family transcriptional regulator